MKTKFDTSKLSKTQSNKLLLILARFLEKLPPKRFRVAVWAEGILRSPSAACGLRGCAGGWAATIPEFKKRGLSFDKKRGLSFDKKPSEIVDSTGDRGVDAMANVSGLTYDEAFDLFIPKLAVGPDASATPKEVAANIRKFVKNR